MRSERSRKFQISAELSLSWFLVLGSWFSCQLSVVCCQNLSKSRKFQINAELSFVLVLGSWFLVPGSVVSCLLSEVRGLNLGKIGKLQISTKLSLVCYQLSVISCLRSEICTWEKAVNFKLALNCLGSWFLVPGSWLLALGSWFLRISTPSESHPASLMPLRV
jgi:hypothetical protein